MFVGFFLVLDPSLLVNQIHLGTVPSWTQLIFALSVAMVAYTGIETVSNMAEEAKDPGRDVPKATNMVVLAVLAVYAGISVVALSALPVTEHAGSFSTALGTTYENDPVLGIVNQLGITGGLLQGMRAYVGILAATILFIATNAGLIGVSRLSWSLSEHRQLPGLFARLHPRYRTPWFTIAFFSVLAVFLLLPGETNFLGNLYSFGAMLSFTMAHIAVVALRFKQPDRPRPYKAPWNVRVRGREVPMTAVLGALGTSAAFVSVLVLHAEARTVGVAWMVVGMAAYFLYRRRQGLDPRRQYKIARDERPPDFAALGYKTAIVPLFGTDLSARALRRAARLLGQDAVVYALYVLHVPRQLPLDAGMEDEELAGRSLLESARIAGRQAGVRVKTGLIRTRNSGATIVDEARRVDADLIYLSEVHAPPSERILGPTANYLLSHRPCRVVIETEAANGRPQRRPEDAYQLHPG